MSQFELVLNRLYHLGEHLDPRAASVAVAQFGNLPRPQAGGLVGLEALNQLGEGDPGKSQLAVPSYGVYLALNSVTLSLSIATGRGKAMDLGQEQPTSIIDQAKKHLLRLDENSKGIVRPIVQATKKKASKLKAMMVVGAMGVLHMMSVKSVVTGDPVGDTITDTAIKGAQAVGDGLERRDAMRSRIREAERPKPDIEGDPPHRIFDADEMARALNKEPSREGDVFGKASGGAAGSTK